MKKVLIAVDDTKSSQSAILTCSSELCSRMSPEEVNILYVEKFQGRSLIDEMLGDAELSTLKEVLEGTEYKEQLDKKAQSIVAHYEKALKEKGASNVKTIITSGHPAEEILKTAKELGVGMIVVGSRGKRTGSMFMGSVSREVVNNAEVPVLVVK